MRHALVVDNNEFYLKVLGDFLREEEYSVATARDGIAALRAVVERRPDLIVLDLVMPKVDGTKVCRHLKSDPDLRKIPVIVLSGILLEDLGNLQMIGADAFVAKMPLDRLLPTLRNVIGRVEEGCDSVLVEGFEGMFRREIVTELLEEKRFRDLLLASLAEGVAELDAEGRVLSVNAAFATLLRRTELDLIDRPLGELLGLPDEEVAHLLRGARDGRRGNAPDRVVRAGELRLRLRVSRVERGADPIGFMLLCDDQTEVLRAQEERESLRSRLAETEKLVALGRMVAGIAHEINNPLTGVLGYAQLLKQRAAGEPQAVQAERILQEAQRCRQVVARLLAFAQQVPPALEPHDLNEVVRDAVDRMGGVLAEADVALELDLQPALPSIPLDRAQMQEVVQELAANAARALARAEAPRRVRIATRRDDRGVELEVMDNGPGIPETDRGRVFDPFFTTAEVGQGAGLGLSAAYGVVQGHGGRLRVANGAGQGTRLVMELPFAPRGAGTAPAATDPRAPARVLVADDEPVILDLLVDLLEARGIEVHTASNGVEALARLASRDYDAVLLDLKMPEMGGREVYETLGRINPRMQRRVLFSTGDMVAGETRAFLDRVGSPVLAKPFQIDQVTEMLKGFLRDQTGAPAAVAGR